MRLTVFDDAVSEKKPVILFFSKPDKNTTVGQQCLSFENFVLRNQKVFDTANEFLRVKIDPFSIDREILKRYRVKTAPTVLFLSSDGTVLGRVVSKSKPDRFLKVMQSALARHKKLLAKAAKS